MKGGTTGLSSRTSASCWALILIQLIWQYRGLARPRSGVICEFFERLLGSVGTVLVVLMMQVRRLVFLCYDMVHD